MYHNSRHLVAKEMAQETLAHLWADPLYTQTTALGAVQARDIVQFVKMNEYANNSTELAAAALAEVPQQLTSYMASKNILPKAKRVCEWCGRW